MMTFSFRDSPYKDEGRNRGHNHEKRKKKLEDNWVHSHFVYGVCFACERPGT